jgi:hypothetical protein
VTPLRPQPRNPFENGGTAKIFRRQLRGAVVFRVCDGTPTAEDGSSGTSCYVHIHLPAAGQLCSTHKLCLAPHHKGASLVKGYASHRQRGGAGEVQSGGLVPATPLCGEEVDMTCERSKAGQRPADRYEHSNWYR